MRARLNLKRPAFVAAAVLLVAGGFGSLWGDMPDNAPVQRGGYQVLEGDFHVHTRFSDGFLSPFEAALLGKRRGLDVVGLTEHNLVFPGKLARWFSPLIDGPVIVVGEEITTRDHHVIALGLNEAVPARLPLATALERVHAQGGVAIGAHPVKRFWPSFEPVAEQLDGAEIMHPIALRSSGSGRDDREWRWNEMREFFERETARGRPLTAIGSSDYHFFMALAVCTTSIFANERSERGVVEALKNGRTVVFGPNGEKFGDPQLIQLLEREPLPPRRRGAGYEATSVWDAIARSVAWLAVLAMVLTARRAR